MTVFNIGDWVIVDKSGYETPYKIVDIAYADNSDIATLDLEYDIVSAEVCRLWKPQEDEWCWFSNHIGEPRLLQYSSKDDCGIKAKNGSTYKYCEPFIGSLPSELAHR